MLYELFLIGDIVFWLLVCLTFIAVLVEVALERFLLAFITTFVFAAILLAFSRIYTEWVPENKSTIVYFAGFYVLAAIVTSIIKWYFYSRDARDRYNDFRSNFLSKNGFHSTSGIPEELRATWLMDLKEYIRRSPVHNPTNYRSTINIQDLIPQARYHKALIVGWMAWWPFVAFWSLFDDFFRRFWDSIYRLFSRFYQAISNSNFKGLDDDIVQPSKNIED